MKIAVAACTIGIAHTYMAQEAIEQSAKSAVMIARWKHRAVWELKNELDEDEIAADAVILAIAIGIEGEERFEKRKKRGKSLRSTRP